MPETPDMDAPVTRRELHAELEQWAKHILEATERAAEAREKRLEDRLEKRFESVVTQLSAEIARHAQATQEYVATQIRVVDEKYQDLPARVTKLERRRRAR